MNKDNNFLVRGLVASTPEKKDIGSYELAEVIVKCSTSAKSKGNPQEALIPVTGWGDTCNEILALQEGDSVEAFGEIRTRIWTSPQGKEITFFSFVAERVVRN